MVFQMSCPMISWHSSLASCMWNLGLPFAWKKCSLQQLRGEEDSVSSVMRVFFIMAARFVVLRFFSGCLKPVRLWMLSKMPGC